MAVFDALVGIVIGTSFFLSLSSGQTDLTPTEDTTERKLDELEIEDIAVAAGCSVVVVIIIVSACVVCLCYERKQLLARHTSGIEAGNKPDTGCCTLLKLVILRLSGKAPSRKKGRDMHRLSGYASIQAHDAEADLPTVGPLLPESRDIPHTDDSSEHDEESGDEGGASPRDDEDGDGTPEGSVVDQLECAVPARTRLTAHRSAPIQNARRMSATYQAGYQAGGNHVTTRSQSNVKRHGSSAHYRSQDGDTKHSSKTGLPMSYDSFYSTGREPILKTHKRPAPPRRHSFM